MKEISVKALAKVNLGLDVVRKRPDGYHEVRMIMQTIHLFDRLEITRNQSGRITMSTNLAFLPTNENNLVYKAAALLKEEFDIGDGIDVKLHKHIPVAGSPSLSTRTTPCIWEQKETPLIRAGSMPEASSTSRVLAHIASHHSAGSCSAPPSGNT